MNMFPDMNLRRAQYKKGIMKSNKTYIISRDTNGDIAVWKNNAEIVLVCGEYHTEDKVWEDAERDPPLFEGDEYLFGVFGRKITKHIDKKLKCEERMLLSIKTTCKLSPMA